MSRDTSRTYKGDYFVVSGAVSMFGCTPLTVEGGGSGLDEALKSYNSFEPEGNITDNQGNEAKQSAYLVVVLKSKVRDEENDH